MRDIKMDVSGFTHEGQTYPGELSRFNTGLERIQSELEGLKLTVDLIERKMPEVAPVPTANTALAG
ncbi:MAG: hypothetical protein ACRDGM_15765 [bacterium]